MLSIATVEAQRHHRYVLVKVLLKNDGTSVVRPGTMFGRQTSEQGAVRHVEFQNSNNIPPGCTAKVSQLLSAMCELELTAYHQSDGVIVPFSGGIVKRLSFLRSVEVGIARWWENVLLPQATFIAARFKAREGNALAEVHKRVNVGAQVVRRTVGSFGAEIARWWGQILVPWSRSVGARFRERRRNASLRLEIDKKVKHWAEVAGEAWRSIHAALVRWRDDALSPRTSSIAARLRALHENGWLRLAGTKQRRTQRAEVERQAWESVDAEITRWWHEVLLPRSRSIAARLKALHENGWLRLARKEQARKHRAQVERQAWESVDAEITRWWHEVLLPRSRYIADRTKEMLRHRSREG